MPIHEYECNKCCKNIEVLQRFNDPDPRCDCGGEMTRLISKSSFHLKGSGWFAKTYDEKESDAKETKGLRD